METDEVEKIIKDYLEYQLDDLIKSYLEKNLRLDVRKVYEYGAPDGGLLQVELYLGSTVIASESACL